jgi:hypothetical protein
MTAIVRAAQRSCDNEGKSAKFKRNRGSSGESRLICVGSPATYRKYDDQVLFLVEFKEDTPTAHSAAKGACKAA